MNLERKRRQNNKQGRQRGTTMLRPNENIGISINLSLKRRNIDHHTPRGITTDATQ
jgi:hypothetical protein